MSNEERPVGSDSGHACFSASFTTDAWSLRTWKLAALHAQHRSQLLAARALVTCQPLRPVACQGAYRAREQRGESSASRRSARGSGRRHDPHADHSPLGGAGRALSEHGERA